MTDQLAGLAVSGGAKITWWGFKILVTKLPVNPTNEQIKNLLLGKIDQIEEQITRVQEAKFKGAMDAFADGIQRLYQSVTELAQPSHVEPDDCFGRDLDVQCGLQMPERAKTDFNEAISKTRDLLYDTTLSDIDRLKIWKVHIECTLILSETKETAQNLMSRKLQEFANHRDKDVLAQYLFGTVKKTGLKSLGFGFGRSFSGPDKNLVKACTKWRHDFARCALCYLGTSGEPESVLRDMISQCIEDEITNTDTESSRTVATDSLRDWLGIIPNGIFQNCATGYELAVLTTGLWLQATKQLVTVYRRDGDSCTVSKVGELKTAYTGYCLSVNRVHEKLFEVLLTTMEDKLVRLQVEQHNDGNTTVSFAGSKSLGEGAEYFLAFYIPSGKVIVRGREQRAAEQPACVPYWLYDKWDTISDPVVKSGNEKNRKPFLHVGTVTIDSMLYFFQLKPNRNGKWKNFSAQVNGLWLVPETENDYHRQIRILKNVGEVFCVYQPSENLVVIHFTLAPRSHSCQIREIMATVFDIASRQIVYQFKYDFSALVADGDS